MVKRSSAPASIEGMKIKILALKIEPSHRPVRIKTDVGIENDYLVYPMQLTRNATGIIVSEYNPKESKFHNESRLDLDDQISGKNLWGFSACPISKIQKGGEAASGKHTGQHSEINGGFPYLCIVMGWSGNAALRHPRDVFLIS